MLPPCIDLGPPSNFEEPPPHVLNTCKKPCRYFQNLNESWYYMECCSTIFHLISSSNNKDFLTCCTSTDNSITHWRDLENDHNSLSLKHSSNIDHLVNQFNNVNPKNRNDPEKISSSKYYDVKEMCNIEIHHKNKLLSLFYINACSLNKNFDELQHLLSCVLKKLLM